LGREKKKINKKIKLVEVFLRQNSASKELFPEPLSPITTRGLGISFSTNSVNTW